MTKQTIEVEGLPEGWRIVSKKFYYPCAHTDMTEKSAFQINVYCEKIKPREVRFVETGEVFHLRGSGYRVYSNGVIQFIEDASGSDIGQKIWREVKETDITLNSDEPKLSLSVDECKALCKRLDILVVRKIEKFIKENS